MSISMNQKIKFAAVFATLCCLASVNAAGPKLEYPLNKGGAVNIIYPENTSYGNGRTEGTTALHFNGAPESSRKGGHVTIPVAGKFDFEKPFTITFWFKASKNFLPNQTGELVSTFNSYLGPGFRIIMTWNALAFISGDGNKCITIRTTHAKFPIEREVWHNVAVVCDGKKAEIYFNGVLAAQSAPETVFKVQNTRGTLFVGSYNSGYACNFNGAIAELKLFDRAMNAAEILSLAKDMQE